MSIQKAQNYKEGNRKGYTLIELLVVISIMAILFAVGTASFREYGRRKELSTLATLVKGDLRLAQEYALSGRKPVEPAGNACTLPTAILEYYTFERTGAGTGYQVRVKCTTNSTPVAIKSVDISGKGIVISTFSNVSGDVLRFRPRGLGVDNITGGTSTFTLTKGTNIQAITVTSGGEIL